MTPAFCPKVPAQINTDCVSYTIINAVGSLYLIKSSFHKQMKTFSILIFLQNACLWQTVTFIQI